MESQRGASIQSFKVMDVLAKALELDRQGHRVCHLEVGQPQSGAPKKVLDAAEKCLRADRLGYTSAMGIEPLRQRISQHYLERYTCTVDSSRIIVTTGSSGAFLLAFMGCFDPGDIIAIASAGYPCYRNILGSLGCELYTIPVNDDFKVTVNELDRASAELQRTRQKRFKGLILSSPSNPTGALLAPDELKGLCDYCDQHGIQFISDEIYHGITFGKEEATALSYSDKVVVINSFSKYYSMTGWRLGWLVAPTSLIATLNRLMQNYQICAPTMSQMAAVQAFECGEELNMHVKRYAVNRGIILEALAQMGFKKVAPADGAFYIYVDTSDVLADSVAFCKDLLEESKVAVTPGNDFEDPGTELGRCRLRISYCGSTEDCVEGMRRMVDFLEQYPGRLARGGAAASRREEKDAPSPTTGRVEN